MLKIYNDIQKIEVELHFFISPHKFSFLNYIKHKNVKYKYETNAKERFYVCTEKKKYYN